MVDILSSQIKMLIMEDKNKLLISWALILAVEADIKE